ncbi:MULTISPECIES: thiaminase II [Exiguobacterium]|jgi:thiaminase/transcriptional activator TenA|uniref:thiaminase II n=1 Tax=Exiguobacterium TaxID=33986 RepID=UPI0004DEE235|nr:MULTISPECIES: thiaminase II [Exiguobacterium]MCC9621630.1 thiaminase II [Thalassospira sp. MA62]MCT4798976.1 thiaminase II [Exiguobacterium profundum]MDX5980723.1 thiaminase II [Exiguobacterium profundum]
MKFTDHLRQEADGLFEASFHHPFVRSLGEGTLDEKKFRHYVMQDSYYLNQFSKVQAKGATLAPTMELSSRFLTHALHTIEAELSLHREFFTMLNVTDVELATFEPAPTAYAYALHMQQAGPTLGDVLASILPCYWVYYEIGERLKDKRPDHPIYSAWIATYGSEWFRELVEEQIDRLDELAGQATEEERVRYTKLFLKSCYYEVAFWEMAWTLESWTLSQEVNQ